MEAACLQVLQSLADARRNFFRRMPMYRRDQEEITLNFINTETEYITLLTRLITNPVVIAFPLNMPTGFMDPVPVLPTAEQITNELVDYEGTAQAACAICQDAISEGGCKLRGCNHYYHRACIQTWFCASSLCPVCRRDIRGGQEDQSSSASSETSLQEMSQ